MATKKVFKVSFKGIILPGFDKDQVIENVHEITRIPEQTITRKFFSGKTVVIRHADSQEYASRLQKTFAQAGIETYINEFTETVSDDDSILVKDSISVKDSIPVDDAKEPELTSDENKVNSADTSPELQKSPKSKIIGAIAALIVISLMTVFFMSSDKEPVQLVNQKNSAKDTNSQQQIAQKTTYSKKQNTTLEANTEKPDKNSDIRKAVKSSEIANLFDKKEIKSVIKITNESQIEQLIYFSTLFGINTNVINTIKNNLNNSLSISQQNPLFVIKLSDDSENNFAILLNTSDTLSSPIIDKLKKELKNKGSTNQCHKIPEINVLNINTHLLLTTFNGKKLDNLKESLNQYPTNLKGLDSLFVQENSILENKEAQTDFNLFHRNNSNSNTLSFTANNESYWLSLDKQSNIKILPLLQQMNLNINQPNKYSTTQTSDVLNNILLIIAQQSAYINDNKQIASKPLKDNFQPEQIVKIVKSYSTKDIQEYKDKLDIELLAQWQDGPFAISTNQFKFDKNLSIELLAKGQNIKNLMEYSRSAYLNINTVLNKKNKNILTKECTETEHYDGYFKDVDGEQEAYIDDDFISYQTITAKKSVNVEAGFNNYDINNIAGEIVLKLPIKIQQKLIELQKTDFITKINDFSVLIKHLPKSNSLEVKVAGNTEHFISIRAYNYSGDVIDTQSLEQTSLFDHKIISYRQTFSEPIEAIKAFYTKENKTIIYPFEFKPEISVETFADEAQDVNGITSTENQLITYTPGKLDFLPLNKNIQEDNPEWLGTKWSSEKITQKVTSPFYLNLFTHESDGGSVDSVLNIKSSLSPFITQNITAVKLTLMDDKNILLDNFLSFTMNEFVDGEPEVRSNGQIIPPQMTLYLNSSSAFEILNQSSPQTNKDKLHGHLTLTLPTAFKTHSKKYTALGQTLKLDGLFVKTVQLNKHQIQFEIRGNIKDLVQLKLYNKKNQLISAPFEFIHLQSNKALITLLYHDKIDTVKLVLSQDSTTEEYPFSFSK